MATPKRIGHLVLNVKDVEASTKFYTESWDLRPRCSAPMVRAPF